MQSVLENGCRVQFLMKVLIVLSPCEKLFKKTERERNNSLLVCRPSSTIWAPDYINVSFIGATVPVYSIQCQGKTSIMQQQGCLVNVQLPEL